MILYAESAAWMAGVSLTRKSWSGSNARPTANQSGA